MWGRIGAELDCGQGRHGQIPGNDFSGKMIEWLCKELHFDQWCVMEYLLAFDVFKN